ncbi:MAG TPA: helix-turn-helix domain-containing protein [Polyangiaceae bacterium]|nr:helix-turn-helix domain-containing protein [Polyangiaceae bacterium]
MLDLHHWHVTDAAAALGVMRYALARAIKKHRRREAH